MRPQNIVALIVAFFLCSCQSVPVAQPTQTILPTTLLPTPTSTPVPVMADISCQPSSNPFAENPMYPGEYQVGYYPNITISRKCTFEGRVSRGQIYKHQIMKDLIFCLVPGGIRNANDGWDIVISDSRPSSCDVISEDYVNFGPIVTPPFHGNRYFDVYGWYFRNQDNTGENDGSINAPQEERFFNFVFNREDYETEWYRGRCMSWGIDTDCAMATQTSSANIGVSWSRAKFSITKLELGNLVPGNYAWIESMEFKLEVYLPEE